MLFHTISNQLLFHRRIVWWHGYIMIDGRLQHEHVVVVGHPVIQVVLALHFRVVISLDQHIFIFDLSIKRITHLLLVRILFGVKTAITCCYFVVDLVLIDSLQTDILVVRLYHVGIYVACGNCCNQFYQIVTAAEHNKQLGVKSGSRSFWK